jgi:hypothetical protein
MVQFDPREASPVLRCNNRAFGSLASSNCTPPQQPLTSRVLAKLLHKSHAKIAFVPGQEPAPAPISCSF